MIFLRETSKIGTFLWALFTDSTLISRFLIFEQLLCNIGEIGSLFSPAHFELFISYLQKIRFFCIKSAVCLRHILDEAIDKIMAIVTIYTCIPELQKFTNNR